MMENQLGSMEKLLIKLNCSMLQMCIIPAAELQ